MAYEPGLSGSGFPYVYDSFTFNVDAMLNAIGMSQANSFRKLEYAFNACSKRTGDGSTSSLTITGGHNFEMSYVATLQVGERGIYPNWTTLPTTAVSGKAIPGVPATGWVTGLDRTKKYRYKYVFTLNGTNFGTRYSRAF